VDVATDAERAAMRRAVSLSTEALGTTNPNPCVGAVVLDADGRVVGEGITQPVGGDHAEVVALRAAGDRARGGTVVVTLEPCRHTGRTQPCTEMIRGAGIARVVYALSDPHDVAAGGGEQLQGAGLDVEPGLLADEVLPVLEPWLLGIGRQRPYLTWKYAATLDGRIAAADGTSRWITGAAARRDVHRERHTADAVIVGIGTVLADDARLTVRDWPAGRQPARVVVDTDARTPASARVLDDAATTLIAVADDVAPERTNALRAAGAEIIPVPRLDGGIHLLALLVALRQREIYIALLEGGPTLAASFLRGGLVDRVVGYHAPMLFGSGLPVVGALGVSTLDAATRLSLCEVTSLGDDVRIVARIPAGRR
jgi:diaminohydroxyphosphoribosylaminopyrimidine deaminase/5-amino-6-(5-phosphoribosylamino)uracil reductase